MKARFVLFVAVSLLVPALRLSAFRLVKDPVLSEEVIRDYLATRVKPPATITKLSVVQVRRGATFVDFTFQCDLELNESLYEAISASDPRLIPWENQKRDLERTQAQLDLIPQEFIALQSELSPPKRPSVPDYTFLQVAAAAHLHVEFNGAGQARHTGLFFNSKWALECPPIVVETWRGQRFAEFKNPRPVDSDAFAQQLASLQEDGKAFHAAADELSRRFLAKATNDRSTLFSKLAAGSVFRIGDTGSAGDRLFLTVSGSNMEQGRVNFGITSSLAGQASRSIEGVFFDRVAKLRQMMDLGAAAVTPKPPLGTPIASRKMTLEEILAAEELLNLDLSSGGPVVGLPRAGSRYVIAQVGQQEIEAERNRIANEQDALREFAKKGAVYEAVIGEAPLVLGILPATNSSADVLAVIVRPKGNENIGRFFEGRMVLDRTDHPIYQFKSGPAVNLPQPIFADGGFEFGLRAAASGFEVVGQFGSAPFKVVQGFEVIDQRGRIVTHETANLLRRINNADHGLFLGTAADIKQVFEAAAPQVSTGNQIGNAFLNMVRVNNQNMSLPKVTARLPAEAAQNSLRSGDPIYGHLYNNSRFFALPLRETDQGFEFEAVRTNQGYLPASDALIPLAVTVLDADTRIISMANVHETGPIALIRRSATGNIEAWYVVRLEIGGKQ